MAGSFWIETLGCPKNQVDSDKLVGTMLADGLVPADEPRGRRRRGGQHLRLRRGGPPGVDRHHPGPRRRPARPVPASWSPAAWPSATATSWPRPSPRSTRSPASACPSPSRAKPSKGGAELVPSLDLLNLPRPAVHLAVGLREGGRGLRPRLRLLRHPVVPGQAALAHRRRHPRRGRRPRRPGRSCSSPRTSPPSAATRAWASGPSSRWWRPSPSGSTGSGCSTSTRPTSPTR